LIAQSTTTGHILSLDTDDASQLSSVEDVVPQSFIDASISDHFVTLFTKNNEQFQQLFKVCV